jgi:hypothetical protein
MANGEQIIVEALQQLIKRADRDKSQQRRETLTKSGKQMQSAN